MVQPTPWQAGKTPQAQAVSPSRAAGGAPRRQVDVANALATLRPLLAALRPVLVLCRGNWGYLGAAISGVITLYALFQPWINASSTDGKIKATPFGKFEISSSLVALWAGSPPPTAKINGTWAVLACITIAVIVVAAVVNLRAQTRALSTLVMGSSIALTFFVIFALVHINNKAPDVRNMVGNGSARDLGSQVGMIVRWASGNSGYALPGVRRYTWTTAGLTSWAWFAGAMAVVSAVAAIGQWVRNRPAGPIQIPLRMPIVITRPSSGPAQPAPEPQQPSASPQPAPEPQQPSASPQPAPEPQQPSPAPQQASTEAASQQAPPEAAPRPAAPDPATKRPSPDPDQTN
ncbi:hypothetical protein [Nocardia sp. NBC_01009]|uniref:hypothetical protein n=1 Tax=Nocardia sp. NBC_01009 TaxID=2975996 RepID=UPI00386895E9|nr:hypothetical protein OHA42_38490 [Nocardia sp. NBC_01009]